MMESALPRLPAEEHDAEKNGLAGSEAAGVDEKEASPSGNPTKTWRGGGSGEPDSLTWRSKVQWPVRQTYTNTWYPVHLGNRLTALRPLGPGRSYTMRKLRLIHRI
jgi:hypothetical protein